MLSCSPHASAGLHPGCLQPTRGCRFASTLSCSPHISAGLHPRCPLILQPTSKLVATTLLTLPIALGLAILKRSRASVLFAVCPYGCSPGALDLPCCVTDSRAAEGGDSDASGAGGPTKTLFASLDISISCDKDKDLDGQRHAMPLAMHVEKDLA